MREKKEKRNEEVVIEGIDSQNTAVEMGQTSTNANGRMYLNVGAQSPISMDIASDGGFPFDGVSGTNSANMPFTIPHVVAQINAPQTPIGQNANDEDSDSVLMCVCEACGKEGSGKVDVADDCFYCFQCWKKWSDPNIDGDAGDYDDLYKKASVTDGFAP